MTLQELQLENRPYSSRELEELATQFLQEHGFRKDGRKQGASNAQQAYFESRMLPGAYCSRRRK